MGDWVFMIGKGKRRSGIQSNLPRSKLASHFFSHISSGDRHSALLASNGFLGLVEEREETAEYCEQIFENHHPIIPSSHPSPCSHHCGTRAPGWAMATPGAFQELLLRGRLIGSRAGKVAVQLQGSRGASACCSARYHDGTKVVDCS